MILYTSETDREIRHKSLRKGMIIYGSVSAFCLIFFLVYDRFSHNVRSPFMTFLFLWPLLLGVLPALILQVFHALPGPGRLTLNLHGSGVAALTVSSAMKGVFDIAGTASPLQTGLMILGAIFCFGGIICYLLSSKHARPQLRIL